MPKKAETVRVKLAVSPAVSVGKTTVAGGAITLIAFASAAVAFWQGARDEITLNALYSGLVALVITLGGRYGQAIAAILAPLLARPAATALPPHDPGSHVAVIGGAPPGSGTAIASSGTQYTMSLTPDPDDEDGPGDDLHEIFEDEPETELPIAGDVGDGDAENSVPRAMLATASRATGAVSGLNEAQRAKAREMVMQAAYLALRNASKVHYTQGARRWEGIAKKMRAWRGEYPKYADCSSFATWVLWQGLGHFHVRDVVNGANWTAGWTGTQLDHGKLVRHERNIKHGDLALYDGHVAICVGRRKSDGKQMVISHGSEGGPYLLPIDYRPDLQQVRRFI